MYAKFRPSTSVRSIRRQAGFSLVEILVGLGIGMIGMVIMLQVFSLSEGYKRTTTGGDDAQTGGAIAMYTLQRDIRQAGFGVSTDVVIGCSLELRTGVTLPAVAPVLINPPTAVIPMGDPNSDRLLVFIGNGNGAPEGDIITQHSNTVNINVYGVAASTLFTVGNYVIAGKEITIHPCARKMEKVSAVNTAANTVTVPLGVNTIDPKDWLIDVGASPKVLAYAIRNSQLTVCDYMLNDCGKASPNDPLIWVPIADSIVSMRAQYARDTVLTDVDIYQQPRHIANTYDQITPLATDNANVWQSILGVRLAIVARSEQFEKTAVTSEAPTWLGSTSVPPITIDLSNEPNWQNYRYRVFQTVVPSRNLTQSQGPTS